MACKQDIYKLLNSFCQTLNKQQYASRHKNERIGVDILNIDLHTKIIVLVCWSKFKEIKYTFDLKGSMEKTELINLKRSITAAKKMWDTICAEDAHDDKREKTIKIAVRTFEMENDFV